MHGSGGGQHFFEIKVHTRHPVMRVVRPPRGSCYLAVHQYRFGLLPRGPLIEKYTTLPESIVVEDFEEAWLQQPSCDVTCLIESFAPRYPSWADHILMWGSGNNGNRIHVVYEDNKIVEVSCRIAAAGARELCGWRHLFSKTL